MATSCTGPAGCFCEFCIPDDVTPAAIPDTSQEVAEHVWAIIDWWRGANEAPGGCSSRESIAGMQEHIFALRDLTGYERPRPSGSGSNHEVVE